MTLDLIAVCYSLRTVSEKNCAKLFCQNLVRFSAILTFFGRKMAKRLKLCEMHHLPLHLRLIRVTTLNAS